MSNVLTINTTLILPQKFTKKEEHFVSLISIFDMNYRALLEILDNWIISFRDLVFSD